MGNGNRSSRDGNIVVAIDPGIAHTGVCAGTTSGRVLHLAEIVTSTKDPLDRRLRELLWGIWEALENARTRRGGLFCDYHLVVEAFNGPLGLTTQYEIGALLAMRAWATATVVPPTKWRKGLLGHARANIGADDATAAVFGKKYRQLARESQHVRDAMGIYLWAVGRRGVNFGDREEEDCGEE